MTPELDAVLSRSDVWRRLYETDARYRAMWDAGIGPGQRNERELVYSAEYNHWAPLHWYAVEHADKWSIRKAKAFFRRWQTKIPGGCDCKKKWRALGLTPDYDSPQAFFEWAWRAHNTVSSEIGKPTVSLCDCYAEWWPERMTNRGGEVVAASTTSDAV